MLSKSSSVPMRYQYFWFRVLYALVNFGWFLTGEQNSALHLWVHPIGGLVLPVYRQNICWKAHSIEAGGNLSGIGQCDTCPLTSIGSFPCPSTLVGFTGSGLLLLHKDEATGGGVCSASVSILRCAPLNTANKWQIIWHFLPPLGSASRRRRRRWKMKRWVLCCETPSIR